jgi:predicted SnoaL-like aldol condensation-catalyzing enzyme
MLVENESVVARWWDEMWSKGDLAVADELHTPDFQDHDPSSPLGEAGSGRHQGEGDRLPERVPRPALTIQKQWIVWDALGLLRQLGAVPE